MYIQTKRTKEIQKKKNQPLPVYGYKGKGKENIAEPVWEEIMYGMPAYVTAVKEV